MGSPDKLARENIMKILISSKSFGKDDTSALKLLKDAGLEPVIEVRFLSIELRAAFCVCGHGSHPG